MARKHTLTYTLELDLDVIYTITPIIPAKLFGPPEHCHPAEGGEIELFSVKHNGLSLKLTEDQLQKLREWITDNHDFEERD